MSITISNVQVGMELQRVMEGFKNKPNWRNPAVVIELTAETIVCQVMVNLPRTMVFDRETGISIEGIDYGWLEY